MRPTLELPAPYKKQHEAISDPARIVIIEASTKTGKTAGCLVWLLQKAWNEGNVGQNYWWIAPVFSQAKNIGFARMKAMLRQADPHKKIWNNHDTELSITLWNGAKIWFKGSDNADSLFGDDVYAAVIDEATRCSEEAWVAVRSTLTATRGPVRIIGNVKGRRNWAYLLARMAEGGEPNMGYHKLTAYDAVDGGVLDLEEVQQAKRVLPDHIFRELYLAEASDDGGNPFGIQAISECIGDLSTEPAVVFGVDLAKSVDFTCVIGLDDDGRVSVCDRWQGVDWKTTIEKIGALIGECPTLVDSTGVGDPVVEDLQRISPFVEGFKFSSTSKQQLMEGLAQIISKRELRFPDNWLRTELDIFEFVHSRTGVKYSAPSGSHDDGVCALALAVRAKNQNANRFQFKVF